MMSEMLLFLVRRFRAGRGMEGAIEQAMKALSDKAAQAAQQPQQNPEMMKLQADQQAEQMRMQAQAQTEQMKMQADAQLTQVKAQLDMQMQQAKVQADMQLQQMKAEFEVAKQNNEMQIKAREMAGKEEYERWKAELDAATKVLVAQIGAKAGLDQAALSAQMAASEELDATLGDGMSEAINRLADMHGQTLGQITGVMQAISAPKRIIRGPDGRAAGVEIAI
jgi:chromosome segregation ATPase